MSSKRITELESAVSELQSTVRGLTEELVESKQRIRTLEAEVEDAKEERNEALALPAVEGREAQPDEVEEAAAEADKADEPQGSDETPAEVGDIIVA